MFIMQSLSGLIEIDNCLFNNSEAVVNLALIFARKINQYL